MRSCLYEGIVVHKRMVPTEHQFQYRVAYPFLDLDEIADITSLHPLWSSEQFNAISFRRRDFLDGKTTDLGGSIRKAVKESIGNAPTGRILMLAQLRSLGWLFNPLVVYYCWNGTNTSIEAIVLEVMNTPWHERHLYVLPGTGSHTIPKEFHVSPFFSMNQTYKIKASAPSSHLVLRLDSFENERRVFSAAIALHQRELTYANMTQFTLRHACQPLKVSLGIYAEAFRLYRKHVPFIPHPTKQRSTA